LSFNMRRSPEPAWTVVMFFYFCSSLKHSFSSLIFSQTVFTTLKLKFRLVLEPRVILLETWSSTDRRCGDREKRVGIPDRLLKNIRTSGFCDAAFSIITLN
jgi:hypothetical protein